MSPTERGDFPQQLKTSDCLELFCVFLPYVSYDHADEGRYFRISLPPMCRIHGNYAHPANNDQSWINCNSEVGVELFLCLMIKSIICCGRNQQPVC